MNESASGDLQNEETITTSTTNNEKSSTIENKQATSEQEPISQEQSSQLPFLIVSNEEVACNYSMNSDNDAEPINESGKTEPVDDDMNKTCVHEEPSVYPKNDDKVLRPQSTLLHLFSI